MKRFVFFALTLSICLGGCGSPSPSREPLAQRGASIVYDYAQLQRELRMSRPPHDLGFSERQFSSCVSKVPGDSGKCGSRYLAIVNFRLVCRDSEGTTTRISSSLKPLTTDSVHWRLGALDGYARTDAAGDGQIQILGLSSASGQRLVMTVGRQFLGLEINEIRQIVLPNYWCTQR